MEKEKKQDGEQKFETIEDVAKYAESVIRDNMIKNIMVGFVSANQMILDFSQEHTLDEVQNFCKSNLKKKNQNVMINVLTKNSKENKL